MISGKNGLKKIALETVSATGKKILRGKVIIGKKNISSFNRKRNFLCNSV